MNTSHNQFSKRIAVIGKKHARMSKGISTHVQPDGLIVARPRKRGPRFPIRGLVSIVVVGFLFKTLLLVQLGAITYQGRIDQMQSGTKMEAIGGWFMQIDPITRSLADFVTYF